MLSCSGYTSTPTDVAALTNSTCEFRETDKAFRRMLGSGGWRGRHGFSSWAQIPLHLGVCCLDYLFLKTWFINFFFPFLCFLVLFFETGSCYVKLLFKITIQREWWVFVVVVEMTKALLYFRGEDPGGLFQEVVGTWICPASLHAG